jgi:hypothetical protein
MRGRVRGTAAAVAAGLALALALPGQAGARTNWVCEVPGEPEPVTFVSAADAALHGITQANEKAGAVFSRQFGENCSVHTVTG